MEMLVKAEIVCQRKHLLFHWSDEDKKDKTIDNRVKPSHRKSKFIHEN
jgi:hypothetical protein